MSRTISIRRVYEQCARCYENLFDGDVLSPMKGTLKALAYCLASD